MTAAAPNPFTPSERSAWSPPRRLTVSEWADANRRLSSRESAEPGPWSTSRTPYLREIQDALGDPTIRFVAIVKPAQVGGSEAARNGLGYWVDCDPGPAIVIYPSEESARENMSERVGRMFRETPSLAAKLTGERHEITDLGIDTRDMPIYAGWAGSPQALASRPCRYVILDEVDKYPPYAGKDAAPLALAEARTRTYAHRAKIVLISTPTTDKGAITMAFESCEDRRRYHVPCPRCNEFILLTRDRFRWEPEPGREPSDPTPEWIERNGVWYECPECSGRIAEHEKDAISARGEWRSDPDENGEIPQRGKSPRVGFQFSAFVATIGVQWRRLIAKWFRVKSDPAKLMEYVTQELGEPFRDLLKDVDQGAVEAKRRGGHPRGIVPTWAACVLVSADTQKDRFYWLARAWGAGERSQLIDLGVAKTFADLEAVLARKFQVGASANTVRPALMLIDSGGGTETAGGANRTDEVYRWAGRHADRVMPCKGMGGKVNPFSAQDVRIGTHTYKRGELSAMKVRLAHINTQHLKDVLSDRIAHKPEAGKPPIWELCDGLPDEYFDHLRAEHKIGIRSGLKWVEQWVIRSHGRRNDYLDCEVYQLAAAKIVGAEYAQEEAALESKRAEVRTTAGAALAVAQAPRQVAEDAGGSRWVDGRGWWRR